MKPLRAPAHFRERGSTIVMALSAIALVTIFATSMLASVDSASKGVRLDVDRSQAHKYAEGLLEVAEQKLVDDLANFRPLPNPPANNPLLVMNGSVAIGGVTGTWKIEKDVQTIAGISSTVPTTTSVDALTGLTKISDAYLVTSDVKIGDAKVRMKRHLMLDKTPIFQFLAFYEDDMEIFPGANMTLAGRLHANGTMYAGTSAQLTVDSKYMRTAEDLIRRRKDDGTLPTGPVKIRNATVATSAGLVTLPSRTDLLALGINSLNGLDSKFTGWDINGDGYFNQAGEMAPFAHRATQLFNGTLQTGEHGVTPIGHPSIGSISPYESKSGGDFALQGSTYVPVTPGTGTHTRGYYHGQAALRIIGTRVYNSAGTEVTSSMPAGFITSRSLYDKRQNRTTTVTEVNMARLGDMDGNTATFDPSPHYPANGLVYATRTDSTVSQPNGIVITGASELNVPAKWDRRQYSGYPGCYANPLYTGTPPVGATDLTVAQKRGMTLVSDCPVYVRGDFNTVNAKASAVICDAVNLLSNAWNYSKTSSTQVTASNTTYNLAFITGNLNTTSGNYNGGFENLPRFHENWSGRTCTIKGSFVNTWQSAKARGNWVYGGNWYTAPTRVWSYDTSFDSGNLPPFTPMVISTRVMAWQSSL